jgi:hypothetical protein
MDCCGGGGGDDDDDDDAICGKLLTRPPELSYNPTSRVIWEQVGGMDEGVEYVKGSLTCCKILQHGASGFTSHLKEGVLWIFIAFKIPMPWPGLNLQPLGPMTSTLTTTLPTWILLF